MDQIQAGVAVEARLERQVEVELDELDGVDVVEISLDEAPIVYDIVPR